MTVTIQTVSGVTTPWVTYTPTLVGFGTPSGVSIWSRRVGATIQIRGKFTSGTSTATEARIPMGFNGTSANVTSNGTVITSIELAGSAALSYTGAFATYILIESAVTYLTIGFQSATAAAQTKQNGNVILASGQSMAFIAEVPISGW